MAAISSTLYSRSLSRQRPGWQTALLSVALLAAPFLAAALDGFLSDLLNHPNLRQMVQPAIITVYIILTAPLMARGDADMLRRLRPVVLVDDERYAELIAEASRVHPASEFAVALGGALVGFGFSRLWELGDGFWLNAYLTLSVSLMFGILAWTIYDSLVSTRVLAALHSQPMAINLLDISPFEPIGRQSLLTTLVFLVGLLLGVLFGLNWADLRLWRTWLAYGPLALVVVVLFFLSMRDTHRVLSEAKGRELALIRQRLRPESARFRRELMSAGPVPEEAHAAMAALLAYEGRIRAAPTWPYNTAMMRTLLFSILLPLAVKAVTWALFER